MVDKNGDIRAKAGWLPFRIVVLAELEPREDYALRCPAPRIDERLTTDTYDRVLSRVEPAFRLAIDDPPSAEVDVDVRWRQWSDVLGGGLLNSPAVLSLTDAHTSLSRATARTDPSPYVRRVLQNDPRWGSEPNRPQAKNASATAAPASADPLGSLLDLVDLPEARDEAAPRSFGLAATELQSAVSDLLRAALAHPEYRRLRRVWRSLHLLAQGVKANGPVELRVVSCSAVATAETLLSGIEADLVVYEAPFEACARDTASLNQLADWAAANATPVIASLDSSWVSPPDPASASPDLRLNAGARRWLDTISGRENSRWLTIALNDTCEAEPVTGALARGGPACVQRRDLESSWTFVPAGVVIATLINDALARRGEPFLSEGAAPMYRSPAMFELTTAAGPVALGTQRFCSESAAAALGTLGICVLVPTVNRDAVRLNEIPTAHRPLTAAGDLGAADSALSDQMLASRVSSLLREAARHSEGATSTAVADWLQGALEALFPWAPPVGPFVDVAANRGELTVTIQPRRYGDVRSEWLRFAVRLP